MRRTYNYLNNNKDKAKVVLKFFKSLKKIEILKKRRGTNQVFVKKYEKNVIYVGNIIL